MNRNRLPIDVRGPLGLLGVGLLAGATGLAVVATNGEDEIGGAPKVRPEVSDVAFVPDAPEQGAEEAPRPERSFDPPPGRPSPVIDPEPAPLPPDDVEGQDVQASPIPQVTIQKQGGSTVLPARAGTAEVVFIVRLKGAPEVDLITRNFKRDPATAQLAWVELTQRIPVLAEFELTGASFSGEMRLSRRLAQATPEAIRQVQDRLLAIDGVAYADPDYVAHPGQKDTP